MQQQAQGITMMEMNTQDAPSLPSSPDEMVYAAKLRQLRHFCDPLRVRAQQFRVDCNEDAANKLETMLAVLDGRRCDIHSLQFWRNETSVVCCRIVSLDYLQKIEKWLQDKSGVLVGF